MEISQQLCRVGHIDGSMSGGRERLDTGKWRRDPPAKDEVIVAFVKMVRQPTNHLVKRGSEIPNKK